MGGFKKKVQDQLMELHNKGDLTFSTDKNNCILDFIVCLPEILLRSVSTGDIMQGFVEGGAVDKETHTWSDINKILAACKEKSFLKKYNRSKRASLSCMIYSQGWEKYRKKCDELGFA